ncbi:12856_t:CDS:1, partial [Acaulospora morrowiae]
DKHPRRDAGLKVMELVVNPLSSKTPLCYLGNFFTENTNKVSLADP